MKTKGGLGREAKPEEIRESDRRPEINPPKKVTLQAREPESLIEDWDDSEYRYLAGME